MLHEAEFENEVGLMSVLLQLGANVDPRSSSGLTPFFQACMNDLEDAARLLLLWGADKDDDLEGLNGDLHAESVGNHKLARLLRTPLGGRRCEIIGLVGRPDLNGMTAVVYQCVGKRGRAGK